MRTSMSAVAVCCLAWLAGCAQLRPNPTHQAESSEQVSWIDEHSSYPSVRRIYFEQLNLIELVDPRREAEVKYRSAWEKSDNYEDRERGWGVKYDLAFAAFRESAESEDRKRAHRNSVQDRIFGVATSRCNVFKTYLRRQQTEWNFLLGSATTAAGVLGAVLTGVNSSRNLAGAAGLFSGLQAEYNQQYFSNLTAHLIIQGIEMRQSRMLATIVKERQTLSTVEYSMEAAVKDAILFDGSCSTVTGLSEASESIKEVTNPGLPRAFEVIAGVRALHEMSQAPNFSELMESGKLQKLLKQATPASTPLIAAAIKSAPAPGIPDRLVSASKAKARVAEEIATNAAAIAKAYGEAQAKLEEGKRSSITGDAIRERFSSSATGAFKALPFDRCIAALDKPAEDVGKATAVASLKPENSAARLAATEELDRAKAQATLAIGRVELLVEAAAAALRANAEEWTAAVKKAAFDDAALKKLPAPTPRDGLLDLCK